MSKELCEHWTGFVKTTMQLCISVLMVVNNYFFNSMSKRSQNIEGVVSLNDKGFLTDLTMTLKEENMNVSLKQKSFIYW